MFLIQVRGGRGEEREEREEEKGKQRKIRLVLYKMNIQTMGEK